MKKYLYLIKNAKIPTYLKYWLMYSSKKISLLIQSLPITLENTIKDLKITINKIYGNTIQDGVPTPENPVPIENVTGNVEVKVQNKNMFNNTFNDLGMYQTATGNIGTFAQGSQYLGAYCQVKEGETYSISRNILTNRFAVGVTKEIPVASTQCLAMARDDTAYKIENITIPNGYSYIVLYLSNNSETSTGLNIQIEKGTATPYIPHQEQNYNISLGDIELCKIGEYQDYIYKENGNWYKYGAIGKVVFDGTQTTTIFSSSSTRTVFSVSGILNLKDYSSVEEQGNLPNLLCSKFKEVSQAASWKSGDISKRRLDADMVYITWDSNKTVTDLETLINGMAIYYPLATPTITQITDTTLLNQLNALEEAHSYEGVTNISSNQNIYLDIDYIKRG